MSAYPRWMELEIAAIEHGDEVVPFASLPPPTPYQPKENEMKTCSKCGVAVGANNKSGVCTPCQRKPGGKPAPARMRGDGDDAVLSRTQLAAPPADEAPPASEELPPESEDLKDFFQLAEALGLDGQKMLDSWCRQWVTKVRTRALGGKPSDDAPPEVQETPAGD